MGAINFGLRNADCGFWISDFAARLPAGVRLPEACRPGGAGQAYGGQVKLRIGGPAEPDKLGGKVREKSYKKQYGAMGSWGVSALGALTRGEGGYGRFVWV